ncbi:MAG: cysteine--tRNA ligase [Pseudomonadota bacterium]
MDLQFFNTATRQKERFEPVEPGQASLYVCGPTVYDRAHLGNARPVVVFDTLFRLLRQTYGPENVTYVRNYTDVEDKINARAAETGRTIGDITDETIRWFDEDMAALNTLMPTHRPRATQYVAEMVALIEKLIENEHAYEAAQHVLFSVRSYKAYGALSGRSVEDMIAGARVEVAPHKQDPMDFVLWKPSNAEEPGWDSPWGRGRPGWHIECSAMARALLGEAFDIHGGGNDLQFPHHENEIAQSRCAHPHERFAKTWMHNEMLLVEGKKMSKSLGNFFTVRDLINQGVSGNAIRLVFLQTHYGKPMDWTEQKRREAERVLARWSDTIGDAAPGQIDGGVLAALADDLNTPGAIARMHAIAKSGDAPTLRASADFLGLTLIRDTERDELVAYARRLETLREAAKATKDFAALDAFKSALIAAGVEVRMSKEGVSLKAVSGIKENYLPEL